MTILAFILWVVIVLLALNHSKGTQSKNNVHFYVARDKNGVLWLYLGKPVRGEDYKVFVANEHGCIINPVSRVVGLNPDDFKDLKWEDEPLEVFVNMED